MIKWMHLAHPDCLHPRADLLNDKLINDCNKKNISFKWPNDVFVNRKKICGVLQETIISGNRKFLIIGIGVNIVSNPEIKNNYQATNILLQTEKKPKIKEIIDLIISSYEKFFIDLNSYDYVNFKKKADVMALN